MVPQGFPPRRRALTAALLCVALLTATAGCTTAEAGRTTKPDSTGSAEKAEKAGKAAPPEPGTDFDYQLGGSYPPPDGAGAVVRDRTAPPAPGVYNVCYVNAFQAQPDATDWWREHHPALLLRDTDGEWVVDRDWDEVLFDTSSPDKRRQLAEIVGEWIDGCAAAGYQAVEPDNLDSYERSRGGLTAADNLAFGKILADRAHAAGLAVGQKNTAALAERGRDLGFDFAVAEECGQYDECDAYADAYDDRVLVVEYRSDGFTAACEEWGDRLSVVLRDVDLVPAGEDGYHRRTC
ncbi:endo alpha-1,4 polygalactosaminidase [Streptomyces sp. UH6]|uniref:endo alpha-1,4 polygalactosaminidase n=1 Tax=Streptomyces sp. UH6 TaxID=2748379 RepID=UPI0015D505BE|nr:endo alpha-1,4 polygalactosaminidase [Streptomyces sp. UH6]NYV76094.1 endo alpha-1,4 polygalactosaminidase [Streptomyces sp. UH6]